jgi:hypothetical protein
MTEKYVIITPFSPEILVVVFHNKTKKLCGLGNRDQYLRYYFGFSTLSILLLYVPEIKKNIIWVY